jgi:RNAse (barnase) inhibitor barstar
MLTATKRSFVIDGSRFSTLAEASVEFTRALGFSMPWNGNLDAFNDFLNGGFGTPDDGFILIWRHAELSRQRLGYGETLFDMLVSIIRDHEDIELRLE